jgi:hypothetical protein
VRLKKQVQSSGSFVQGPAFASSNCFLTGGQSASAGAAADVQGLSASHGGQTSEQGDKLSSGVGGWQHQDGTGAKASASGIANTNAGDHFLDLSGDLATNDVLISLERHGE